MSTADFAAALKAMNDTSVTDTPLSSADLLTLVLDAIEAQSDEAWVDANLQLRILQYGNARAKEAVSLSHGEGPTAEQVERGGRALEGTIHFLGGEKEAREYAREVLRAAYEGQ